MTFVSYPPVAAFSSPSSDQWSYRNGNWPLSPSCLYQIFGDANFLPFTVGVWVLFVLSISDLADFCTGPIKAAKFAPIVWHSGIGTNLNVEIFEKLKVGKAMLFRKVQITRCHVVSRPVRPCLRSAYWGKYLPSQYSQSRIPRLEGRRDHHTIISGHSSKRQL